MKSKNVLKVILKSTKSPFFYVKKRNKKLPNKLSLKKYDPVVKAHVEFEEKKMK